MSDETYIPDFDDSGHGDAERLAEAERIKKKYAHEPRVAWYLLQDAYANNKYIRDCAFYEGHDENKLKLKESAVEYIHDLHKQAAVERMKALNATPGKLNGCKYCLGKGYTVGLRNEFELVSYPCSCAPTKKG